MTWHCNSVILLLMLPILAQGAETDFFKEIDAVPSPSDGVQENNKWSLSGEVDYRLHYATDDQGAEFAFRRNDAGFTSSRVDAYLQITYSPNDELSLRLSGLASYDHEAYSSRNEIVLDETYIDWGKPQGWRIKFGRQLLVWGESAYFRVLDVINPLDEREFGLAELDEARLPVFGTRVSYSYKRWGVDLMLIQEYRKTYRDSAQGDFDPFMRLGGRANVDFIDKPDVRFSNPDWGLRVFFSRPWGDVSALIAKTHQYDAVFSAYQDGQFIAEYPKVETAGLAANYIEGSWLLKGEYGYQRGGFFLRDDIDEQLLEDIAIPNVSLEKSLHQWMLGGRYAGINNMTLDFEMLIRHIDEYQTELSDERTESSAVLNIGYEMMNDRLLLNVLWMSWWQQKSNVVRLRMDYEWFDELLIYGGYIDYQSSQSDGRLYPFQDNDRLFMGMSYSF